MLKDKKGQLMALEFKDFMVGFIVGIIITIIALVVLAKMGKIDFLLNFICPTGR